MTITATGVSTASGTYNSADVAIGTVSGGCISAATGSGGSFTANCIVYGAPDLPSTGTFDIRTGSGAGLPPVVYSGTFPVAGADRVIVGDTGHYHALATPARALDTRRPGNGGTFGPGDTHALDLSRYFPAVGGTPVAAVLNLTVVDPTVRGFLTVYPAGTERPLASSINKDAGDIRSNSVTVQVGQGGMVDIYNAVGTTDVVVDVLGWYAGLADATAGVPDRPTTDNGASYVAYSSPFRVYDSRDGVGPRPFASGNRLTVTLPEATAGTVTAVAVNLTAVDPTGAGYLVAWNGSGTKPTVSSVNFVAGQTLPNFAVVPVTQVACAAGGSNGCYQFTVESDISPRTDLVVDVSGVYIGGSQTSGMTFHPTAPDRILDTRTQPAGPFGPGETRDVPLDGTTFTDDGGYGGAVYALNLNVTGVQGTATTFLTLWGDSTTPRPVVSNLNPGAGEIVANAAQPGYSAVKGNDGAFALYNALGSIDVVADLQGYFTSAFDGHGYTPPLTPPTVFDLSRS